MQPLKNVFISSRFLLGRNRRRGNRKGNMTSWGGEHTGEKEKNWNRETEKGERMIMTTSTSLWCYLLYLCVLCTPVGKICVFQLVRVCVYCERLLLLCHLHPLCVLWDVLCIFTVIFYLTVLQFNIHSWMERIIFILPCWEANGALNSNN